MANVSFTLSVTKPVPFPQGVQTITGNINIITIGNPGPENINTAYNGLGYFSYLPANISNLQFNNAGPPPIYVAATTAHGSATLATTGTAPPRATLTIGLFNTVASPTKLFQVQDTAPPGAPAGTILQSAQVSYNVVASGAVGTAVTLVRPALPTTVYMCFRGNTNPILVTDPDVVTCSIDLVNLVFSGVINIDSGTAQTLYVSSDGVTWLAQAGSPWTPSGTVAATSVAIVTPGQQVAAAAFPVSGTLSGYTTAPTLNYADDSGSFLPLPTGATVTTTTWAFTNPGLAAGSHTITVRDANATGTTVTSPSFTVAAAVTAGLSINTPVQQPTGATFVVTGAITGYTTAPTLNYRDDSGTWVALPGSPTVTATTFSFVHPTMTAGAHTVGVRDANNTATAVTSGSFNVVAPLVPVITVNLPSLPIATTPFTVSGTMANEPAIPTLTYTDDAGSPNAMPVGALVTVNSFSFTHPGLAAGSHTTVVSDGVQTGTTGAYSVSAAIPGGASPDKTVVTTTTGSITDNAANHYTITAGAQVAINGVVPGTAVTVAGLSMLANVTSTLSGGVYTYTISTLVNGTSTVGAFWFAWLPAESFLPSLPLSIIPTAGWTGTIVGPEAGGYSIQWVATTPIISGATAVFSFTTVDSPTTLFTAAASFPTTLVATSFIYVAAPFGDPGAQVVPANNVPSSLILTTSNVIELAWVSGIIYYENVSGLWFHEASPAGPWLPIGGTLTSPLAASSTPTVTLNAAPTAIAPNVAFTVTGSLSNYSAAPTLTLSDDGGPANALPVGAVVTLTTFSFTHAGIASGSHTLLVSDGTRSSTISYVVSSSAFTSLSPTSLLTNTITGLSPGHSYQIEVFASNAFGQGPPSAILTVSTASIVVVVPNAPTGLASAGVTQTAVNLFWLAPVGGATPSGYGTQWSPTGANTWTAGPVVAVTQAQITGLSAGTTYDFEVWAINASGAGPFSSIFTTATAAAPATAITWQPQGASAAIALSNGNLTATAGGSATPIGGTRQAVVATQSVTAAKASFEVTLTGVSDSVSVGLANATFPLSSQLGSDNNSIGYFPANIPATVATTSSVSGLPLWGVGVDLDYPSNTNPGASTTWTFFTNNFATPRTCLQYPGGWTSQAEVTSNITSYSAGWKSNGYWNGTIAAKGGVSLKPCIPIAAVPLTLLDGTITLVSAAAGDNNAFFTNILDLWVAAGFRKIAIRLCWEDNYPTTPTGQGASPGSSFPAGTYCPWAFYGYGANAAAVTAYTSNFIKAWRTVAFAMKQHAAAIGMDLTMVWGPTIINSNFIDWRLSYPDSVLTDGRGRLAECFGPDFYFGNFWGDLNLRSGYNTQAPFTTGTVTLTQLTDAAHATASQHAFGLDTGSKYYWSDWTDGYHAPPTTPTTNLGFEGGMSMYGAMVFALQNQMSMMWCEFGGLDHWDGGTNAVPSAPNQGTDPGGNLDWANEPTLAHYARTRIAWFQDKTKNGIANGTFLQFSFWRGQGAEMLQAFATEFHELATNSGNNPDAGAGAGGATVTTTSPGIVPTTIRTNNAAVLVPSGNAPAADIAGAVVSVCFDTTVTPGLFWVTSPSMRASFGANAWNDSATANPGTGVGGIPFTIAGAVTACFDTGESGGIAVLNAGGSPYAFSGMPSSFPPLHGTPPVIVAPGAVTALVAAQASQSITMPASIPNQTAGQIFYVQFAFNYKPNVATLYFTPYAATGNIVYNGITFSPFTDIPPTGGSITWDSTGTIATIGWILGATVTHPVQVIDVQSPTVTVASANVSVLIVATAGSGGGTYTATATAPSTAVALSWTAPSTGTLPVTYIIEQSPTGLGTYSIVGSSTSTSASLAGLNPGVAYDYIVYAANGAGNGTPSGLVTYTIPGVSNQLAPLAPIGTSSSNATTSSIQITWQAAASGSAATGYSVQYKLASASTFTAFSPTTVSQQQVITGLTAGTTYNFQVTAFNAVGSSPASAPAVTASTLPPVVVNPTGNALLTMLQKTSGTGVISGQFIGTGALTPINTIDTADGQFLGLIGGDYWAPGGFGAPNLAFNANAISYWQKGGLAMLTLSWPNPTTGAAATDVSNLTPATLLTAGSAANTALTNSMSQVAAGLTALQTAGVQVILRPFAHLNTTDYWWGAGTTATSLTAAQFVALWQYVYSYFTASQALKNLVWCYDAVSPFSSWPQSLTRYPGTSYVDVMGLDVFSSLVVSVTPTDVITINTIPSPVAGQTFSVSAVGTLVWTSVSNVQISVGPNLALTGAQAAGYGVTLSSNGLTATVTGLIAGQAGNYTAYMRDNGAGVTSPGQGYIVTAAVVIGGGGGSTGTGGTLTSVPGVPYLGFGLELCYPGDTGFTTDGIIDAVLVMQHYTAAFCKPTNMLLYTGSFENVGAYNFGINSYLGYWNGNAAFNTATLGYNLIPVLGISLTTWDGVMSFANIISGAGDAAIQSYMQTCLNQGYKTIVLRIGYEDNLPTTPGGMSASTNNNGSTSNVNGLPWQLYGGEAIIDFSSTIAGLLPGHKAFADNYIKAWRRFAHVVQQFALANSMTVWKVWGPCIMNSCWFDPRLMYPDTASYQAADGWGKLVDCHGPDLYFANPNVVDTVHMKHGYDALTAAAPFNGNFATTGTAANNLAFFADIGSELYMADFRSGAGAALQNSYNSNPLATMPWSGGWGVFESMVFALQQHCMWGVPEGYADEADAQNYSKNAGTNLYGGPVTPAGLTFPNLPEVAQYLRKRITWYQNATSNGIFAGQVLHMSFWGSSAGIEMLQAFAAAFPEVATVSGNNPFAGQANVVFPTPN